MPALEVSLHDQRVGRLIRKLNGNLQFRYDKEYSTSRNPVPLSQSLPLQAAAFPHRTCLAFFANLLPEGNALDRVTEILKVSANNPYMILEAIGGDCAGAVMLWPEGQEQGTINVAPHQLSADELENLVVTLEDRPLAIDNDGKARLSLAGAQPKTPVIFEDTHFALPRGGQPPTTHILKPGPRAYPGLVENEFFCMRLAMAVGLPVANVEKHQSKSGCPFLLVERYDRDRTSEPIRRIHQEDMCQALGKPPDSKYQSEGGPSAGEVMALLQRVSALPAQDRPTLWKAFVFNYLIGNCDAHGKNFSLLYDRTTPHLSPLYDLVSTAIYPELNTRLAMYVDGAKFLEEVQPASWSDLAQEIGFSEIYAKKLVNDFSRVIGIKALELALLPEHENTTVKQIVEGIEKRIAR